MANNYLASDWIGYYPETLRTRRHTRHVLPAAAVTLAVSAFILLLIAGPGSRTSLWSFRVGFEIMKYGSLSGLAAAVLGASALLATPFRKSGQNGAAALSILAVVIGCITFAVPYYWKQTAGNLPKIHDISTDTVDPPRFVESLTQRKNSANSLEYGGPDIAVKQEQAYPDIAPVTLPQVPEYAFALALENARRMGWTVVATTPDEGRIEANDTTFWFGFTDDIVIRISPFARGSLIDIRSVSRVGLSDAGTNARRIRKFFTMLKEHI